LVGRIKGDVHETLTKQVTDLTEEVARLLKKADIAIDTFSKQFQDYIKGLHKKKSTKENQNYRKNKKPKKQHNLKTLNPVLIIVN
jgi:hypothetical protein